MTDTLIVIPVRANSRGVPNKALRPLNGVSCLARTIRTAQVVGAEVVVTTNDGTVAHQAEALGVTVVQQPETLALPEVPLDAPIEWATRQMEQGRAPYAIVVSLQCTSPFTRPELVQRAIQVVREFHTTAITVRDDRGLRWHAPANDGILASRAPARVTRQQMPPEWRETGAIVATPRAYVTPTWRFAHTAWLLPVTGREALDIDSPEDWALAEWYAGPRTRETLLAQVLSGPRVPAMPTMVFSAYREPPRESEDRWERVTLAERQDVHLLYGDHTRHEAELAVDRAKGAADLCLVTSAYHQLRAFLTTLHVVRGRGLSVRLWNAPAPSSMEKLTQEYEKIATYQAKGDCASDEDGLAHLAERVPA